MLTMANHTVVVSVNLTSEQVKQYYLGKKTRIQVYSDDGRSISVPYDILLKFVSHQGIYGRFEIIYNDEGKFISIVRVN